MQQMTENVFDETGNTVAQGVPEAVEEENATAPEETAEAAASSADEPSNSTKKEPLSTEKYRIGDKYFETQDQALAYAQSLEREKEIADAYRQGMKEALYQPQTAAENVTPPQDDLNTEELYTNPKEFLNKFASKIKTETRAELDSKEAQKQQSDQIWREFVERHPGLADFRGEVESFVSSSVNDVRAIIATRGRSSAYDWVATKIKSRFEAYANAVKPKRELPNGSQAASPSSKASGVTPKEPPKKLLSFADQIRTIRNKKR